MYANPPESARYRWASSIPAGASEQNGELVPEHPPDRPRASRNLSTGDTDEHGVPRIMAQ